MYFWEHTTTFWDNIILKWIQILFGLKLPQILSTELSDRLADDNKNRGLSKALKYSQVDLMMNILNTFVGCS